LDSSAYPLLTDGGGTLLAYGGTRTLLTDGRRSLLAYAGSKALSLNDCRDTGIRHGWCESLPTDRGGCVRGSEAGVYTLRLQRRLIRINQELVREGILRLRGHRDHSPGRQRNG
jgi:hypothetical protein